MNWFWGLCFLFFLSFFLSSCFTCTETVGYGLLWTGKEWDREWAPRPTALFTQLLVEVLLYVHGNCRLWFIMDGERVGQGMRAQAHRPVHWHSSWLKCCFTSTETVGYGLLWTGKEWDREWEPRPTALFTDTAPGWSVALRPQKPEAY